MKTREKTAIFPLQLVPEWAAMTKIPCISLMIRELDAESSSYQTAASATQSAIFAFSAKR